MFENKDVFIKELIQRSKRQYGKDISSLSKDNIYLIVSDMVREYAVERWKYTSDCIIGNQEKVLYYFSMEFLMGRLFTNNIIGLDIYDVINDGLKDISFDLSIADCEKDAGLGNGGLGRLAACFLDSLTYLNYPVVGHCIRYKYGLFKQLIVNNEQVEVPDVWMANGNVWEIVSEIEPIDVKFYGDIIYKDIGNGQYQFIHNNAQVIKAVAYDVPIVAQNSKITNKLRLWKPELDDNVYSNLSYSKYINDVNLIDQSLYPDDSTYKGKVLRLKQEYFFVSAGIISLVNKHFSHYNTLDNLASKVVVQLNDTHPVLAIPELIRVLIDDYGYTWDKAYNITCNVMAYTNHTVLSEALERWHIDMFKELLPRIYMIIKEIDTRYAGFAIDIFNNDYHKLNSTLIIQDQYINMANMAVICCFSINGVAQLHSDIIKKQLFNLYYQIWPNKFNNKTNGITQRRWLFNSNKELTNLIKDTIGDGFINDFSKLGELINYVDNRELQERFMQVKRERKKILSKYIYDKLNIKINIDSIFDTQAKRLHAYKRQLLNVLHIIYLYQRLKEDKEFKLYPQTFIFSAKAAPSYIFAKKVIKLINVLEKIINNDPLVNQYITVVFIPNYSVSIAEMLINASDVSQQISTAGKEASGTGNMKFMMNGAITLGALDGANVEIDNLVTSEHDIIFGLKANEILEVKKNYNAYDLYNQDIRINRVLNALVDGSLCDNKDEFKIIYDDLLLYNDQYLVLRDFDAYIRAQQEVQRRYSDRYQFSKTCLVNIAKSCYFSSDRTMKEYVNDIWGIKQINNE